MFEVRPQVHYGRSGDLRCDPAHGAQSGSKAFYASQDEARATAAGERSPNWLLIDLDRLHYENIRTGWKHLSEPPAKLHTASGWDGTRNGYRNGVDGHEAAF